MAFSLAAYGSFWSRTDIRLAAALGRKQTFADGRPVRMFATVCGAIIAVRAAPMNERSVSPKLRVVALESCQLWSIVDYDIRQCGVLLGEVLLV